MFPLVFMIPILLIYTFKKYNLYCICSLGVLLRNSMSDSYATYLVGGDILHCNPLHGTVFINTVEWISIPWSGFQ